MRTQLLNALFAVMAFLADVHGKESPISVSVAVPAHNGERRIVYGNRTTHIHVIVSNTSDKPQRIWQEWWSWGYYGLTFEFTDAAGKKGIAKKQLTGWRRNFPSWHTVEPQESLVLDVHFGDSDTREGFPCPENRLTDSHDAGAV